MKVKHALLGLIAMLLITANADEMSGAKASGAKAAGSVLGAWGSESGLSNRGMKPLSSSGSMQSNNGTSFDVSMDCPAPENFMRVVVFPQSSGDINQIGISVDFDGDNSFDFAKAFVGPFSAVCMNGVISCSSGSFSNCAAYEWKASDEAIELNAVEMKSVGSCYCINNSCGDNLLSKNSKKILDDIGSGISLAVKKHHPRLKIGSSTQADQFTSDFYATNSDCQIDKRPEQYYSRMNELESKGSAEKSNPNSTAYFIDNSESANQRRKDFNSCSIRREIPTTSVGADEVIQWIYFDDPAYHSDCGGDNCEVYSLGDYRPNSYGNNSNCKKYIAKQVFKVRYPNYVESATIESGSYDDYLEVVVNGRPVFSDLPKNTSSCERRGGPGISSPIDITSIFNSVSKDDTVEYVQNLWVGGKGEMTTDLKIVTNEACEAGDDHIDDNCGHLESSEKCVLKDEWVDGIQTKRNFIATGLYPLPSSKEIVADNGCVAGTYTRPYWEIKRVYACELEEQPYEMEDIGRRADMVSGSFDPTSGNFDDTQKGENGDWSDSQGSISLVPAEDASCFQSCKVRKPFPGSGVSEAGTVASNNKDGISWDYTFRNCEPTCKTEYGEEVVEDCRCRSEFGQAASFMQLIRMTAEDMICTDE